MDGNPLKDILREITPPIAWKTAGRIARAINPPPSQTERIRGHLENDELFDGQDAMYKSVLASARCYFEYGCGQSTVWVSRNANATIGSVDTSREWLDFVRPLLGDRASEARLVHCDLGPLGEWGRPLSYAHRGRFRDYIDAAWNDPARVPDTVLIDGRFRVACFLRALIGGAPGTRIIFDDYEGRPHYKLVEDFCPKADSNGRQALFLVDEAGDRARIAAELERFIYVLD